MNKVKRVNPQLLVSLGISVLIIVIGVSCFLAGYYVGKTSKGIDVELVEGDTNYNSFELPYDYYDYYY